MIPFNLSEFMFEPINLGSNTVQRIDVLNVSALEKAAGISAGSLIRSLNSQNGLYPDSYSRKVHEVLLELGFNLGKKPETQYERFVTEINRLIDISKKKKPTKLNALKLVDKFINDAEVYEFKVLSTPKELMSAVHYYADIFELTANERLFVSNVIKQAFHNVNK